MGCGVSKKVEEQEEVLNGALLAWEPFDWLAGISQRLDRLTCPRCLEKFRWPGG